MLKIKKLFQAENHDFPGLSTQSCVCLKLYVHDTQVLEMYVYNSP